MKKNKITRRRALATLGASGFATVGAGLGGLVLTTEPSLAYTAQSQGNDLRFRWVETHNGDVIEGLTEFNSDVPGFTIMLDDIKPDDTGALGIEMALQGDESLSVDPYFAFDLEETSENGRNEPEEAAGDTSTGSNEGELQEYIDVEIWYDTGIADIDMMGGSNLEREGGEQLIDPNKAEGTLEEVANAFPDQTDYKDPGFRLDPNPTTPDKECLTTDNSVIIGFGWEFPSVPGVNVTQSDSVLFDLLFSADNEGEEC